MELIVQFPSRGSTQVLNDFFLMCWPTVTLPIPMTFHQFHDLDTKLDHYTTYELFRMEHSWRVWHSQAGRSLLLPDTWFRHLWFSGDLSTVMLNCLPQWRCISSFVFYIFVTLVPFAVWSWYTVPREGFLLCLFPDWHFHSVFSVKPPYIHFRCVAGIHGGCG